MPTYKTPGVKIEEIKSFPPSVVPVATAIPVFIGYTNKTTHKGETLINVPTKVDSLIEYTEVFGTIKNEITAITVNSNGDITAGLPSLSHRMFYSIQMFFNNGGKECYIISVGVDSSTIDNTELENGLLALEKENEPTIIFFPDAIEIKTSGSFDDTKYYGLMIKALDHCQKLKNKVLLIDVPRTSATETTNVGKFRTGIGTSNLKYGIAYYPEIETTLSFGFDESSVTVSGVSGLGAPLILKKETDPNNNTSLFHSSKNNIYQKVIEQLNALKIILTPSAAMAGVFARVDRTRGVHIAPANVSIVNGKPSYIIDDDAQRGLNVPNDGKSINAIRAIKNRGNAVVWGARTLDGSSNEWRYVNVRRYFIYVEQSVKQSSYQFIFEPNNKNTWERVKAMIVNFLTNEWSSGALAGDKPEDAFFVRIGLGDTMSALDILEGKMNVEIGMAVVRPAEFIILKFSHKMQEA